MLLQLVQAEYDCACGSTHRYTEGGPYDYHQDLMIGNKRWLYQEVEEINAIAIIDAESPVSIGPNLVSQSR